MTITLLPPITTPSDPDDEGQDQPTTTPDAETTLPLSSAQAISDDQLNPEDQLPGVVAESDIEGGQTDSDTQNPGAPLGELPLLHSPTLGLAAEIVDDLERVRNANQNRLRQMTAPTTATGSEDEGWEGRGFGLSLDDPDVARLAGLVDYLGIAYNDAVKNLEKTVKAHPLGKWVKKTPGIGEKQFGRLLAATGDPYWHYRQDRPRTVSELWAYCGYHVLHAVGQDSDADHKVLANGVAPKRQKGKKVNWSMTARMRMRLIAESCLKAKTSPYNAVYYAAREKYAESVHMQPCVQCGKKGHPAEVGTPLRPGHKHARALRIVSKTILKDLWVESKRLHELQEETIEQATTILDASSPA